MDIAPFATENYFSLYEFNTPHLLSVSDCETLSINDLLKIAGKTPAELCSLRLGYTESQGNLDLRTAVARNYELISANDVVVLTSPVEGIFLVMQALLESSDEVIVMTPAYDALINVAEHLSHHVHRWTVLPTDSGWELDLAALADLTTSQTKMIVVNFPHNPTGLLPDRGQFEALIQIARQSESWLFCDEMYRGLEYGLQRRLPSAVDLYEKAIVLSGLSKTHGLPGLRAGWLIVPDAQTRSAIVNWKHYTTICPAAPSEYLALVALEVGDELAERNKTIIRQNLSLADSFFADWDSLFTWRPPQAGSVALVGLQVNSATDYCHDLAQSAGVLLLPAQFMGYDDHHVRFGFGRKSFPSALAHYQAFLEQKNRKQMD